jgi:uncharacterized damage-inducible protein DinB
MKPVTLGALALLTIAAVAPAASQAPAAAAPPRALTGVRGEILFQFDDAISKVLQLAEAIPQEKYSWRPSAGVRSVSQVLMHVSGANYYVLSFAGVKAPTDLPADAENTVTDKAQVIAQLRRSADHVRTALRSLPDADLEKAATMFGQATTNRNVFFTTATHAHEHLGQLIAYARSNAIVPPWSRGAGQ